VRLTACIGNADGHIYVANDDVFNIATGDDDHEIWIVNRPDRRRRCARRLCDRPDVNLCAVKKECEVSKRVAITTTP
jgi:hypothetical protein